MQIVIVIVCTQGRRQQPLDVRRGYVAPVSLGPTAQNTNTRSMSNAREQHLDGRDLGGSQIELVAPCPATCKGV